MRKLWAITLALFRQNRWLLLLLVLWPWVFTALLTQIGGRPSADDVLSLLHQECFYGLALVAVLAASAFSGELNSHRAASVLSRAVSRGLYLAALGLAVFIPALLFAASVAGSGWLALANTGLDASSLVVMVALLLLLMVWVSSLGLLFSLVLPGIVASVAVGLVAAGWLYFGIVRPWAGVGPLFALAMQLPNSHLEAIATPGIDSIVSVVVQACVLSVVAWAIFERKDISSATGL